MPAVRIDELRMGALEELVIEGAGRDGAAYSATVTVHITPSHVCGLGVTVTAWSWRVVVEWPDVIDRGYQGVAVHQRHGQHFRIRREFTKAAYAADFINGL